MSSLLSGVDEAGRGSVIGPLILVGVTLDQNTIQQLMTAGLKDSKLFLSSTARKKRDKLANEIQRHAQQTVIVELSAQTIDQTLERRPKDNLNLLELRKIGKLLIELTAPEIVIDTIGPPEYARKHLMTIVRGFEENFQTNPISCSRDLCIFTVNPPYGSKKRVLVSIGADRKFPAVSAASCVSKSIRDQRLRDIEQEWGLPHASLGKGYPNATDSAIMSFFENYEKEIKARHFPFIRYTWGWPRLQNILHSTSMKLDSLLQSSKSTK